MEMDPEDLNNENGVDYLLEELNKLDQSYAAYMNFEKFHGERNMNMAGYVILCKQKYKCNKYEMVLPDAVVAIKLLDNAGITQSDSQLGLTA